jgi:hypothetical protein
MLMLTVMRMTNPRKKVMLHPILIPFERTALAPHGVPLQVLSAAASAITVSLRLRSFQWKDLRRFPADCFGRDLDVSFATTKRVTTFDRRTMTERGSESVAGERLIMRSGSLGTLNQARFSRAEVGHPALNL